MRRFIQLILMDTGSAEDQVLLATCQFIQVDIVCGSYIRECLKEHEKTENNVFFAVFVKFHQRCHGIDHPQGVRCCKRKTSQNESKNQFFGPILTNSLRQNKNCQISDALHCIASTVKISNQVDHISRGYDQKAIQKQRKIGLQFEVIWGSTSYEVTKNGISMPLNISFTYGFILFLDTSIALHITHLQGHFCRPKSLAILGL